MHQQHVRVIGAEAHRRRRRCIDEVGQGFRRHLIAFRGSGFLGQNRPGDEDEEQGEHRHARVGKARKLVHDFRAQSDGRRGFRKT